MNKKIYQKISHGCIHKIPLDLKEVLISNPQSLKTWESITPIARNEWICWIDSAKKTDTRNRRVEIARINLKAGKRRPCCWAGCVHRTSIKNIE